MLLFLVLSSIYVLYSYMYYTVKSLGLIAPAIVRLPMVSRYVWFVFLVSRYIGFFTQCAECRTYILISFGCILAVLGQLFVSLHGPFCIRTVLGCTFYFRCSIVESSTFLFFTDPFIFFIDL